MQTIRRHWQAVAAALLACAGPQAHAQTFPDKPIHIVVPLTPGGSNDVLARALAKEMSATFGQPVIVENRPGASGNIGTDYVAKSPADGYTLGIAPNQTVAVNPVLYPNLPFDVSKDLAGISMLGRLPQVLVVSDKVKASSVDELIALAKRSPGKLSFASAGAGSPQHMSAEIFQSLTDTRMIHIPYKGSAPALVDVLAGTVDVMFCPINSVLPHIRNGRVRALGVSGQTRLAMLPDVPTIIQSVPGFENDIWIAMVAPAKTPSATIEKINTELRRALALPSVQKSLAEQGIETVVSTPAELDSIIAADQKRWAEVIKKANIKID